MKKALYCCNNKKIKKSGRETKPCMGKWGTTLMAWEMAWSLGSPLRPFSSANILKGKKRWFALWGGLFVLYCVSLRNCYFLVWNGRRAKEKDGLSVVQLNKLWAFCLSLFMSSVTPNPNPTHSNHAIFPTPPHTLSLKKLK